MCVKHGVLLEGSARQIVASEKCEHEKIEMKANTCYHCLFKIS